MGRILDLMGPALRIGFALSLAFISVICLVDVVRRYRTSRLQFSTKHLFVITLLAAHAGSIVAFSRSVPSVTQRIDHLPAWLSVPMGFLILLYVFGPVGILVCYGGHEASQGRPYYLLVFLLYLLALNRFSSLAV